MKKMIYLLFLTSLACAQNVYFVENTGNSGIFLLDSGSSAGPTTAISSMANLGEFLKFLSLYTGVAILLVSVHKYFEYRKKSEYVTLSYVVTLVMTGLALIGVSYIPLMA